jgi:hypothetical protein
MFKYFNIEIYIALLSLNTGIYVRNCYHIQFMLCYTNGHVSITPLIFKVPLLHTNTKTSH